MNPIRIVCTVLFRRRLQETGPALTFARLCTSRHLEDLQWIAFGMILLAYLAVAFAIDSFDPASFSVNSTVAGALAAAAVAVLNWVFQSGSRRIGAVDLFACEISVICRVSLVVDFARSSVDWARSLHQSEPSPPAGALPSPTGDGPVPSHDKERRKFTSEEHYTPVYDGQIADLEPLDVNVVTYVTEFYTYRKTMMDYLRGIAAAKDLDQSQRLMDQMIYMQFLMYESGRLAIGELVEFEPNRAESIVNILCSELVAFTYLQPRHDHDFRGDRLRLRLNEYRTIVPELCRSIESSEHPSWQRAKTTVPELTRRYEEMCSTLGIESDSRAEASASAAV